MTNLKKSEIVKAFENYKYALLTSANTGKIYGVNCKVINLKLNQNRINNEEDKETMYKSVEPCSLNEYINLKMPFDRK